MAQHPAQPKIKLKICYNNFYIHHHGFYTGVEPKIGGVSPKMDGENNGKPY